MSEKAETFIVFIILFILISFSFDKVYGFQRYGYDHGIIEDKLRTDLTSPGIRCGETREMGLHEAVFMETPNYSKGKKYPNSITCKWNFHLKGCTLAITCPKFDLNKFLCFDYLDVSDGSGRYKRFCGNQGPQGVYMEDKVSLVFRSSPSFSSSGFRCYAICVPQGPEPYMDTELMLPSIPFTSIGMCACGKQSKSQMGARIGTTQKFPWVAKVLRKKDHKFLCAATLVSNQYLVTAAHCFTTPDVDTPDKILITLNEKPKEAGLSKQSSKNRKVSEIRRYLEHGIKYELDADVALIKLEEAIDFYRQDDISPICLPKGEDASKHFVGSFAYLSRWEWDKDWHGQHLQSSRSVVVNNENCTKTTDPNDFRRRNNWTAAVSRTNTFCTKSLSRTCQSISGSPLTTVEQKGRFARFTLIGIGTWGSNCGLRTGVNTHSFTRVTEIVSWIISNTQDSSFCKS